MKTSPIRFFLLTFTIFILSIFTCSAQYATRKVSKKQQAYTDSLKQVEYNFIFPLLGQKVYKAGFDIPYPVGIMANYMGMSQRILLDNMRLGLKTDNLDIPLTNVDEFLVFGDNWNDSYTANFRPDIWIFPFLNVYGIFGQGKSTTSVRLVSPIEIPATVEQTLTTKGFGLMGAFGIGPLWMSVDGTWTWNKPELLDKSVGVNVIGIRLGKTFTSKSNPQRNLAFWLGGMRARMQSETVGQISLIDALPPELWERRDEMVNNYRMWYDGLSNIQKALVDQTPLPAIVDRIEMADGDAIIRYGMDKQVFAEWNMVIGAQYQFNKRWMVRTEWGVVGDRKSGLLSLNYRFLL